MKIKVILLETIKGVGKKEEIVEVKDGYANNFLFPQKKAIIANEQNLNKLKQKNEKIINNDKRELEKATKLKAEIEGKVVKLKVKSGDNGKIFGSIGAKEIMQEIENQLKLKLDKKQMPSDSRIKSLGNHTLQLKLYKDIKASIVLNVEGE